MSKRDHASQVRITLPRKVSWRLHSYLSPKPVVRGPEPGPDSRVTDEGRWRCPPLTTFKMPLAEVRLEAHRLSPTPPWAAQGHEGALSVSPSPT